MNNLIGKRFGRLTVLRDSKKRQQKSIIWTCICLCGNFVDVRADSLIRKNTKSCGCLKIENAKRQASGNIKHGDARFGKLEKIYSIWLNMKNRCYNPNNDYYHRYGQRGIQICNEWKSNYLVFKHWALVNGYRVGLTIDRINNDGDYEPLNCRWITRAENARKGTK